MEILKQLTIKRKWNQWKTSFKKRNKPEKLLVI